MNGTSIRKAATICGINRNTAFIWRHKILDALQNMANDVELDGIVEADETFFPISYKGNHSKSSKFSMPRPAHQRGHATHLRGISKEKVCVPCVVNRNGLSIAKVANLGRVSTIICIFCLFQPQKSVGGSLFILLTQTKNPYKIN